jgi:hypothetical protein
MMSKTDMLGCAASSSPEVKDEEIKCRLFFHRFFHSNLQWNRKKGKNDHTFFVAGRGLSHIGFQKKFDHFYIIQLSFLLGKI